jgi:hypothetical protein
MVRMSIHLGFGRNSKPTTDVRGDIGGRLLIVKDFYG